MAEMKREERKCENNNLEFGLGKCQGYGVNEALL